MLHCRSSRLLDCHSDAHHLTDFKALLVMGLSHVMSRVENLKEI